MIAAILALLQADTALAALLPGGIYDAAGVTVISRQTTPLAFDGNQELRPCALLQARSARPVGGAIDASEVGLTLYFYQRAQSVQIDQARMRCYTLLHRQRIAPASGGAWAVRHAEDVLSQFDLSLRAQLIVSRYTVPLLRRV